jgi:hypothetical protein
MKRQLLHTPYHSPHGWALSSICELVALLVVNCDKYESSQQELCYDWSELGFVEDAMISTKEVWCNVRLRLFYSIVLYCLALCCHPE